ncbi:hypothetical protein Y032_0049g1826 [Ancylostoma ceylanicum]|uniref:Uncharacterized protein n=1 Tax=Ancylostoma ceylanicum TaxID=53326 RepID=A0A016UAA3_9BILA|nr:hypothetical protein Y032_0049g1826 [Ancylostoma ceylanicum]
MHPQAVCIIGITQGKRVNTSQIYLSSVNTFTLRNLNGASKGIWPSAHLPRIILLMHPGPGLALGVSTESVVFPKRVPISCKDELS